MLLTILYAFIQRIIVNIVSIVPCVLLALALFEGWRTTPYNSQVLGYCYESPKQEKVSPTFKYLVQNLKAYNGVKI